MPEAASQEVSVRIIDQDVHGQLGYTERVTNDISIEARRQERLTNLPQRGSRIKQFPEHTCVPLRTVFGGIPGDTKDKPHSIRKRRLTLIDQDVQRLAEQGVLGFAGTRATLALIFGNDPKG